MTATVTLGQRILLWGVPSLVTVAGGYWFLTLPESGSRQLLVILALLIAAGTWHQYLSIPRRITLQGDTLRCERALKAASVPLASIREIHASPWQRGFARLFADDDRITCLQRTPGLRELLAEIVRRHPQITVKGDLTPR